jgi:adenylate kinase family enzyme
MPDVIKSRIEVYERQTKPILQFYNEKGVPFAEFKCESLELPPEVAVDSILKQIKRLKLA